MRITLEVKPPNAKRIDLYQNKKVEIKDGIVIFYYIDFDGEEKTREVRLSEIQKITFEE